MKYQGPEPNGSGGGLPGVTVPLVTFTVGSGDPGVPNNGDKAWHVGTFEGQDLTNKQLLVVREGIPVLWNTTSTVGDIQRFNNGTTAGFDWTGILAFQGGERFQIYITGINDTIE